MKLMLKFFKTVAHVNTKLKNY